MRKWVEETPDESWDASLAQLGGHPLQSTLWGNARREIEGIPDRRLLLLENDRVTFMARVEERRIPGFGRVAWIPKGPTSRRADPVAVREEFAAELKARGFDLLVTDRWVSSEPKEGAPGSRPRTIFIDLSVGADAVWKQLDSKVRSSVTRAGREGVSCDASQDPADLKWFAELCKRIEEGKGFRGPGSPAVMERIVNRGSNAVSGILLVARAGTTRAAGAIVIRCGSSLHYFWGASDRTHSRLQAGEALQWAVLKWACSQSLALYDMEGIDPEGNPGVFQFKRKFGGAVVELEGKESTPLSWRGRLIDRVRRAWRP